MHKQRSVELRDETAWPGPCWAAARNAAAGNGGGWPRSGIRKSAFDLRRTYSEGWDCGVAVEQIHDLQPLRFALHPFRPGLLDDAVLCMRIRSFDAVVARL